MNLCEHTTELVVFDTETLDRWDDAVVLSVAATYGDLKKPLTLEQLIEEHTFFMKFSANEQMKAGRKCCPDTLKWWKSDKVCEEARKVSLYGDQSNDQPMDKFINAYITWAHKQLFEPKKVIVSDRNLFDVRKLQHIIEVTLGKKSHEPWNYHNVIDIVSTLRAWGADRYAGVDVRSLPNAVYHDPRYDAAIDWLRIQATAVKIGILELNDETA